MYGSSCKDPRGRFARETNASATGNEYIGMSIYSKLTLALQIIFVRMGLTFLLSSIYMWFTKVPDFPFGAKGIRLLLVLRGATGFFGLAVFYCEQFRATLED